MEIFNPEQVGGKLVDAAFGVGGSKFLFIIEEGGGETTLGVIVHFAGANLELDNLLIVSDDGSMERLVAILFWHGNIVFDAAIHGMKKGVNNAKDKIAGCGVFDNKAQSDDVVDAVDVLIVFGKLLMQRIDGFDAAIAAIFDVFLFEGLLDGFLCGLELFVGFFEAFSGEFFEFLVALRINIHETGFFDFDTNAAHLEAVGKWREDLERLAGDFLLLVRRECAKGTKVVKTIG